MTTKETKAIVDLYWEKVFVNLKPRMTPSRLGITSRNPTEGEKIRDAWDAGREDLRGAIFDDMVALRKALDILIGLKMGDQ